MMKKVMDFLLITFVAVLIVSAFSSISQAATESTGDVKAMEERIAKIEAKMGEGVTFLGLSVQKAVLSGFIELDYDYFETKDILDENSGHTSDLGLGTVELALKVFYNEWVKSNVALRAEDVFKDGGDDNIFLDEAILTMRAPWAPFYFTGGKTALPFGVFETHTISGALTEDIYEVESVGAIFGFAPDFLGLDASISLYRGENVIENLEGFGTHEFAPAREEEDDVKSYVANVTLMPIEDMLTVSGFFDSEPGDDDRNNSIGGALTLNYWKFSLDGEYITALQREKGADGEENKESAWFVGLAFLPLEPLELAVRYEDFDDDRSGDQDGVPNYRLVGGVNYSFWDYATVLFEYRGTEFETGSGSTAEDWLNEFHVRLALEF